MRLLPLLMVLMMAASCGKKSSGSSPTPGGSTRGNQDTGPNTPQAEEECLAEDCVVTTSDGTSTDLLDSLIDVQAQVTDSQIIFPVGKVSVVQGEKISCKTEVMTGEIYHYTISGNTMQLQTAGGSYSMERLNDSGAGVTGTWKWKGSQSDMFMIKTLSVVSNSRVILKNHCEK